MVILDLGRPDIDGVDVCLQLRRGFTNPILVLSADGDEDRKIAARRRGGRLRPMPFPMPELLARVRVADRHRRRAAMSSDPPAVRLGDLVMDIGAHEARAGDAAIELTPREFALLLFLARHPGRLLTHGILLEQAWGGSSRGGVESLRVHVNQLRKKLGVGDRRPRLLTEPGIGYRLALSEPP